LLDSLLQEIVNVMMSDENGENRGEAEIRKQTINNQNNITFSFSGASAQGTGDTLAKPASYDQHDQLSPVKCDHDKLSPVKYELAKLSAVNCELCGAMEANEDELRTHMLLVHVEGSPACPFCDLANLEPASLQAHVNSEHMQFLTPELEHGTAYLDSDTAQFGSLWELEKSALEGLTQDGLENSPCDNEEDISKMTNRYSASIKGNPFSDGEDSDTEMHTTLRESLKSGSCGESNSVADLESNSGLDLESNSGLDLESNSGLDMESVQSGSGSSSGMDIDSTRSGSGVDMSQDCSPLQSNTNSALSSPVNPKRKQFKRDRSALSLPLRQSSSRTHGTTLSSPASPTVAQLTCPICPFTHSNPEVLQTHVNRIHLDECSPGNSRAQDKREPDFPCPICNKTFDQPAALETHVNRIHIHELSPAKPAPLCCPVCQETCWNQNQLHTHVESHFTAGQSSQLGNSQTTSTASDRLLAEQLHTTELAKLKNKEENEFDNLRAQYGMDNDGNFSEQADAALMKAVSKGQITVKDYYEKKADLAATIRTGMDDGSSRTINVTQNLLPLISKMTGVRTLLMSNHVDHFSSTYGDKGWGCGFRNMQMLLSSLQSINKFKTHLASLKNPLLDSSGTGGVPSIPRLQELLECTWKEGFDPAGCEQLGGKVVNTRKWIGATEIFCMLSYLGIECSIIDFHRPSGEGGTHPHLINWVWKYYSPGGSLPPLYLQHQGHSRTICGVEKSGKAMRLVILDPSHSYKTFTPSSLRMVLKPIATLRSQQYQVVSVTGLLSAAGREKARTKPIQSTRIP
jgi:hypothetical protein